MVDLRKRGGTGGGPVKHLSTKEVARANRIGRATLERWLATGELRPPRTVHVGEAKFRHWTDADVERVRKHKMQHYRKARRGTNK